MMTLEQAINRLEDMVSGCYQQQFLKSELRNNTKEAVELLKFNLMSILKLQNEAVRDQAFNSIIDIVLDNTQVPKSWQNKGLKTYADFCRNRKDIHKILQYPDIVEECIECCNIIQKKLDEDETPEELADHALQSLNRRYFHKYLYFRNNDVGSQYVWIKKFTRNGNCHLHQWCQQHHRPV